MRSDDTGNVTMESLLDRSDADVRGVRSSREGDGFMRQKPAPAPAPTSSKSHSGGMRPVDNSKFLRHAYGEAALRGGGYEYGGEPYAEPQHEEYAPSSGGGDPYSYSPQAMDGSGGAYPYDAYYSGDAYSSGHGYQTEHRRTPAAGAPRQQPDTRLQNPPGYTGAPAPTFAGEANKRGGIYDRLSNPTSFTGVSIFLPSQTQKTFIVINIIDV